MTWDSEKEEDKSTCGKDNRLSHHFWIMTNLYIKLCSNVGEENGEIMKGIYKKRGRFTMACFEEEDISWLVTNDLSCNLIFILIEFRQGQLSKSTISISDFWSLD